MHAPVSSHPLHTALHSLHYPASIDIPAVSSKTSARLHLLQWLATAYNAALYTKCKSIQPSIRAENSSDPATELQWYQLHQYCCIVGVCHNSAAGVKLVEGGKDETGNVKSKANNQYDALAIIYRFVTLIGHSQQTTDVDLTPVLSTNYFIAQNHQRVYPLKHNYIPANSRLSSAIRLAHRNAATAAAVVDHSQMQQQIASTKQRIAEQEALLAAYGSSSNIEVQDISEVASALDASLQQLTAVMDKFNHITTADTSQIHHLVKDHLAHTDTAVQRDEDETAAKLAAVVDSCYSTRHQVIERFQDIGQIHQSMQALTDPTLTTKLKSSLQAISDDTQHIQQLNDYEHTIKTSILRVQRQQSLASEQPQALHTRSGSAGTRYKIVSL